MQASEFDGEVAGPAMCWAGESPRPSSLQATCWGVFVEKNQLRSIRACLAANSLSIQSWTCQSAERCSLVRLLLA